MAAAKKAQSPFLSEMLPLLKQALCRKRHPMAATIWYLKSLAWYVPLALESTRVYRTPRYRSPRQARMTDCPFILIYLFPSWLCLLYLPCQNCLFLHLLFLWIDPSFQVLIASLRISLYIKEAFTSRVPIHSFRKYLFNVKHCSSHQGYSNE